MARPGLETFLVEWKRGTHPRQDSVSRHLETFLVEWKPASPQRLPWPRSTLETFLVEWKLCEESLSPILVAP